MRLLLGISPEFVDIAPSKMDSTLRANGMVAGDLTVWSLKPRMLKTSMFTHVGMFDTPDEFHQVPSISNDAASWLQLLLDEHSGPCELSNY